MPDYKGNISQVYKLMRNNGATKQTEAQFAKDMNTSASARLKVYGQLKKWGTQGIGSGYGEFVKMITPNGAKPSQPKTVAKSTEQAKGVGEQMFGGASEPAVLTAGTVAGGTAKQQSAPAEPVRTQAKATDTAWGKYSGDYSTPIDLSRQPQQKAQMPNLVEQMKAKDNQPTFEEEHGLFRAVNVPKKNAMSRLEQTNRANASAQRLADKESKKIQGLVDDAIAEGDVNANKIYEQNSNNQGVYGGNISNVLFSEKLAQGVKDPDKMVENIQKNLSENFESYLSENSAQIAKDADALGLDVGTYVDKHVTPKLMEQVQKQMGNSQILRNMPKSDAQYVLEGVTSWIPNMILGAAMQSRGAYEAQQAANAAYGEELDKRISDSNGWDKVGAIATKYGRTGVEFADPAFGATFKAGGALGKAVAGKVGLTALAERGAEAMFKRTSQYALKFGSKAGAMMDGLLAKGTSKGFGRQYVATLPGEILGQTIGMNAYGAMGAGISTLGSSGDLLQAGMAAKDAFFDSHGAVSATAFAVAMPLLHGPWNVLGLGYKKGASALNKAGWIGAKLGYDAASILGTGAVMQVSNNVNNLISGEKTDWTLNGFMSETSVAAAMKINPSVIAHLGNGIHYGKGSELFSKSTKAEVCKLMGKDSFEEAMSEVFPDMAKSGGAASAEQVAEAQTKYLKLLNNLSWDAQNELNVNLTGSLTIQRPRTASFSFKGDDVLEHDKDGNVLSVTSFKNEDEKRAYITQKALQTRNADFFDVYGTALDKDKVATEGVVTADVRAVMEKDPIRRTAKDWEVLSVAGKVLKDIAYPEGEVHVEHSMNEGARIAEEAKLTTDEPDVQKVAELNASVDAAQEELAQTYKDYEWGEDYAEMKAQGLSDADAYARLLEMYNEADLAVLAKAVNKQAGQDGFMTGVQNQIETEVSERSNKFTTGEWTVNGEENNGEAAIHLKNDNGDDYILVAGDILWDTNQRAVSENPIMVMDDATGEVHAVNASDFVFGGIESAEEFSNRKREELGVKATNVIDPEGKMNPENKPAADAVGTEGDGVDSQKSEGGEATAEPLPNEVVTGNDTTAEPQATEQVPIEEPNVETTEGGIPLGEDGEPVYTADGVKASQVVDEIYNKSGLDKETADGFVDDKLDEAKKAYEKAQKKEVKLKKGEGLNAFKARKAENDAIVEAAKKEADRWQEIYDEAHKFDMEEVTEPEISDAEFAKTMEGFEEDPMMMILANMPKITPEAYYKETGLSAKDRPAFWLASKEKGGKTVDEAVLSLRELFENNANIDESFIRDTVIEAIKNGGPRSWAKRLREDYEDSMRAGMERDEQRQKDSWAMDNFGMSYDEWEEYETQAKERIAEKYRGVDMDALHAVIAESIENETKKEIDNGRKNERTNGGSEVLPRERTGAEGGTAEGTDSAGEVRPGAKVQGEDGQASGNESVNPKSEDIRKEVPLTEEQIRGFKGIDDDAKDAAVDFLNGEEEPGGFGELYYRQVAEQFKGKKPEVAKTPEKPKAEGPKQVSVEGLFADLNKNGTAKLSDNVIQEDGTLVKDNFKVGDTFVNDNYTTARVDLVKGDVVRLQWETKKPEQPTAKGTKLLDKKLIAKWLNENGMKPDSTKAAESPKSDGPQIVIGKPGLKIDKPQRTEQKAQDKAAIDKADAELADFLSGFGKKFIDAGKGQLSASLVGLNGEQLKLVGQLSSHIAKSAMARIKAGVHDVEAIINEIKGKFSSYMKQAGLDDEDINDLLGDKLRKYKMRDENGERLTIEDWAKKYSNIEPNKEINDGNTRTNGATGGTVQEPEVGTDAPAVNGGVRTSGTGKPNSEQPVGGKSKSDTREPDLFDGESEEVGSKLNGGKRDSESATAGGVRVQSGGESGTGNGGRVRGGGRGNGGTGDNTELNPAKPVASDPTSKGGKKTYEPKNQRNYSYPEDKGAPKRNKSKEVRLSDNVTAIELLHTLISENRDATAEEREILARFTGWGKLDVDNLSNEYYIKLYGSANQKALVDIIKKLDPDGKMGLVKAIQHSALTSFYTPVPVARAMNNFLKKAGFKSGSMLDPSMGLGVFEGTLPESIKNNVALNGVELDWLTGNLVKRLYPDANIKITGFEKVGVAPNSHDVVMSNIPFGDFGVADPSWIADKSPVRDHAQKRIHNYFAVKMLESTKPGGLCVIMTSNAIMDTKGNKLFRDYIADNAELVGAIRLPDNTFAGADTKVVTDVLFLRKFRNEEDRANTLNDEEYASTKAAFLSEGSRNVDGIDVKYNGYYDKHPEMLIGDVKAGGQYREDEFGLHYTTEGNAIDEISSKMEELVDKLVGDRAGKLIDTKVTKREALQAVRESFTGDADFISTDNLIVQNGKVGKLVEKKNEYGEVERTFVEDTTLKKMMPRVEKLMPLRKAMKQIVSEEINRASDERLKELRDELNKAYNEYVDKFGRLNEKDNDYLDADINGFSLRNLEKWEEGKFVGLSDIFTKKVIKAELDKSAIKSAQDVIAASLSEYGDVREEFLKEFLGDNWREETKDLLFELPNSDGSYETKDAYLSGDVKTKLEQAKIAAETDERFEKNVEALEAVQPKDIPFDDIVIHMGARWIPVEMYNEFAKEILGLRYAGRRWGGEMKSKIDYIKAADAYEFRLDEGEMGPESVKWTTNRCSASKIFEAALLDKTITIKDKVSSDPDIYVVNVAETEAANDKVTEMREMFEDWLSQKSERIESLQRLYNDLFNRTVLREWDGSHLTIPGLMGMELRPHQKDAVWMLLNQRGGIVDHIVGAGKSLVMFSTAMEMRRMGIAKKPMIIGLKSTLGQLAKEFAEAFPQARILFPTEKDFEKKNRKNFLAKIAQNDYDCVVMSHENYCNLPHSEEVEDRVANEKIAQIEATLEYMRGQTQDAWTKRQIKGLEKRIANEMAKIEKRRSKRTEAEFTFEEMGIDYMFVDECQAFKNLAYSTSSGNVAGLGDAKGSAKSDSLLLGVRYLQSLHQGDFGTVFLSGTTLTNSVVEAYNHMNYLRPGELDRLGMNTFDAWASCFTQKTKEFEYGVTNELKEKTRFRNFDNLPELARMYKEIADVRNDENLKLPKPKMNVHIVTVPQTEKMAEINREIINMVKTKNGSYFGKGSDDKTPWGLVATDLSTKAALSLKLIDETIEDEGGKIPMACKNVKDMYDKFAEQKGCQMIFLDKGVGKDVTGQELYGSVARELVNQTSKEQWDAFVAEYKIKNPMPKGMSMEAIMQSTGEAIQNDLTKTKAATTRWMSKICKAYAERYGIVYDSLEESVKLSTGGYSAYRDIISRLVNEYGIPRNEVVDIHEAKTQADRKELFRKANAGEVRVLIGGTKNMGTGVNAQVRLIAEHHLDIPWTPSDVDQRNGRGARQGNMIARDHNDNKVEIFYYATEGSLDMYRYQLQDIKGKMFDRFKMAALGERSFDEGADGDALDPAEVVAMLSGNSVILDKSKQDKLVAKLRRAKRSFQSDYQRKVAGAEDIKQSIARFEGFAKANIEDQKLISPEFKPDEKGVYPANVTVTLDGTESKTFDKPKEAGEYIKDALNLGRKVKLSGFGIDAIYGDTNSEFYLNTKSGIPYMAKCEANMDAAHIGTIYRSLLQKVYKNAEAYQSEIAKKKEFLANLDLGDGVWPKEKELEEAIAKQKELDKEYRALANNDIDYEVGGKVVYQGEEYKITGVNKEQKIIEIGGPGQVLEFKDVEKYYTKAQTEEMERKKAQEEANRFSPEVIAKVDSIITEGTDDEGHKYKDYNDDDVTIRVTDYSDKVYAIFGVTENVGWAAYGNDRGTELIDTLELLGFQGEYKMNTGWKDKKGNPVKEENAWMVSKKDPSAIKRAEDAIRRYYARKYEEGEVRLSEDLDAEVVARDEEYAKAVADGDREKAMRMLQEEADRKLNTMILPNDGDVEGFKYHRGAAPKKTFKRYAVLNVTPEGFKAAYAGNGTGTPIGVWLDAQNLKSYLSDKVQFADGTFATYIKGDTGASAASKFSKERMEELGVKGSDRMLLERGGKHSSDVPNFSQMNTYTNEAGEKVKSAKEGALPHNKLIFEIEYGMSEDGDLSEQVKVDGRIDKAGKNQGYAKIQPNQYYDFKTNPNAVGKWGIGGTFRITRLVPHDEVVSVTENYKKEAVAEAERAYKAGEISKKDYDAQIKNANAIQVQKWVGGYHPEDFGLSTESVEKMRKEGEKQKVMDITYDDNGELIPLSERFNENKNDLRYKEGDATSRITQSSEVIQKHVEKVGKGVQMHTDMSGVPAKARKGVKNGTVKGWWDEKTNSVHLYMPNIKSKYEAERTIVHETVGHKGMRGLLNTKENPNGYNRYMDMLWMDKGNTALHEFVKKHMPTRGWDLYEAIDEWIAREAEKDVTPENLSMWGKIKYAFTEAIRKAGYMWNPNIADVRYALWLAKRGGGNSPLDPLWRARKAAMREKIMKADYSPAVKDGEYVSDATGRIVEGKTVRASEELAPTAETEGTVVRPAADAAGTLSDENLTPGGKAVRDNYDARLRTRAFKYREAFHDNMESLRVLQEEIGGKDVKDAENAYLAENHITSISEAQWNKFRVQKFQPLEKAINKCVGLLGGKAKDALDQVECYLYKKHGLERNRQMFVRKAIDAYAKTKEAQEAIENYKFMMAEGLSPDDMADMGKGNLRTPDSLWSKFKDEESALYRKMEKGELTFGEYLGGLDEVIKNEIDGEYDPNKVDYSGVSEFDSERVLDGKAVEYDEGKIIGEVEDMEGTLGKERVDEIYSALKSATDYAVDYSYESGQADSNSAKGIKGMYRWYVPLRGWAEDKMEDIYDRYNNDGGNGVGKVLKRAKGRTSLADSPLATISKMANDAISYGERNKMLQKFYRLVAKNENDAVKVSEVWEVDKNYDPEAEGDATGRIVEQKWEIAMPEITDDMSAMDIADAVDKFNAEMRKRELEGTARKVIGRPQYPAGFKSKMNANKHAVRVYINGREKWMWVCGDPRAAQALRGELSHKDKAVAPLRWLKNTTAALATSYSPEFILSNLERDTLFSNANIASKENGAYLAKFTKNQAVCAGLMGFSGIGGDKVGGESLFEKYYRGREPKNATEKMFFEFMDNGGRTGFVAQQQLEKHKSELQASIKDNSIGAKGWDALASIGKMIPKGIEEMNMRAELVNRFATYMTSRQMGRSKLRSVADAKEVSVNFNRHGAGNATEGGWGSTAGFMRDYYMFFNAGMQSMELMYRNMSKDKSTAIKTFAYMGAVPAMVGTAFAMLMASQDDEKYSNIPSWDRRNNICIPIGDKYVKIALPIELRAFWGMGDIMASLKHKRLQTEESPAFAMAGQITQALPLDVLEAGEQRFKKDTWWTPWLPTSMRPMAELLTNTSWTGKPIQKDPKFNPNAPQWTLAYNSTNKQLVEICKYVHDKTRKGNETAQETDVTGVNISPAKIEHLLKSYFSGAFSMLGKSANLVNGIKEGELDLAHAPMLSRVFGSYTDKESDATKNAKYWSYKNEADDTYKEYTNKANKTNPAAKVELDGSARGKRCKIYKAAEKRIKGLQKAIDNCKDKDMEKQYKMQMAEIKRELVDALDRVE